MYFLIINFKTPCSASFKIKRVQMDGIEADIQSKLEILNEKVVKSLSDMS